MNLCSVLAQPSTRSNGLRHFPSRASECEEWGPRLGRHPRPVATSKSGILREVRIEQREILRHQPTVLANELLVEPKIAATILRALNEHQIPSERRSRSTDGLGGAASMMRGSVFSTRQRTCDHCGKLGRRQVCTSPIRILAIRRAWPIALRVNYWKVLASASNARILCSCGSDFAVHFHATVCSAFLCNG